MTNQDSSDEQKNYLQGFVAGSDLARTTRGLPTFAATLARQGIQAGGPGQSAPATEVLPPGPEAIHYVAQNRFLAAGKKLGAEEEAKRRHNPLDMWDQLCERAQQGAYPKGTDVLLTKYHGLFYVAPAQNSFMCRLRLPGGILAAYQARGVADLAERYGGGYVDATTRANLQIREITAENSIHLLTGLQELGIVTRGSGADNIRNVTATPTAGIDPQELIDTLPLARQMHHYILNHREMYGLPRKFNIAFDGAGTIAALEDTNDIGFSAVRVGSGQPVPEGIYFRLQLGGITGHRDFAADTGVLLKPEECVSVAAAIVRVFIDNGDRTDRKKARLKYVLDDWGHEKYLAEVEKHLPWKLCRLPLECCQPRPAAIRNAHVGFHPQRQPDRHYVGVVLPVGRLTVERLRGLAAIAQRYGSGTLRLTVWQNLLISDIASADIPAAQAELNKLGLAWEATAIRAGLVACTGNAGCRFAASNTKRHATAIVEYLEPRVELNHPLNIHLTGCPNSCAQHYIGDIGLLGAKVAIGDDMVEGYHLYVGGGFGPDQDVGRELYRNVRADQAPVVVERMLRAYLAARTDDAESFREFVLRHSTEQLLECFGPAEVECSAVA